MSFSHLRGRVRECARGSGELLAFLDVDGNDPRAEQVVREEMQSDHPLQMAGELDDIKAIFEGEVDLRAVIAYLGTLKERPGWQPDYVNLIRMHEDVLRDWGEIHDGEDFWAEAEQAVEKRRRRSAAGHSPHPNLLQ